MRTPSSPENPGVEGRGIEPGAPVAEAADLATGAGMWPRAHAALATIVKVIPLGRADARPSGAATPGGARANGARHALAEAAAPVETRVHGHARDDAAAVTPAARAAAETAERPLPEALEKSLRSLADLEAGWDGYGAVPAERAAIEHAGDFLRRLGRDRVLTPGSLSFSLLPNSEGGVDIHWEHPDKDCDFIVWVTPQGRIGWWGKTPGTEATDESVDPDEPFEPGMELPAELLRYLRDIPPA